MLTIVDRQQKKTSGWICIALVAGLAGMFLLSLWLGRYAISPKELLSLVAGRAVSDEMTVVVFYSIRLPRLLCAMLIGAALSMSGAAFQGIFRNPLVSPDILGAAAGAGFGAALAIFLGLGKIVLQLLAFGFGVLGVAVSALIGVSLAARGRDQTVTLVLCGVVITALFTALISGVKLAADPYDELPAITFWLMGGLNYVTPEDVLIMATPLLLGGSMLFLLRFRLNVLSLSDEEIEAIGIDPRRARALVILCATLLTSGSVAVGGMIGWVGLMVPHIARLMVGPDYRKLLPVSLLVGAIFLLAADNAARTLLPTELPLGILTAMAGAPTFLVLLARDGERGRVK